MKETFRKILSVNRREIKVPSPRTGYLSLRCSPKDETENLEARLLPFYEPTRSLFGRVWLVRVHKGARDRQSLSDSRIRVRLGIRRHVNQPVHINSEG